MGRAIRMQSAAFFSRLGELVLLIGACWCCTGTPNLLHASFELLEIATVRLSAIMRIFSLIFTVVCSVRGSAAEVCKCSNKTCTAQGGDECCLWDFPSVDLSPNLEGHPFGFVLGSVFVGGSNSPSVCVTYPISDEHVDSKNYFLISLESVGPWPEMW